MATVFDGSTLTITLDTPTGGVLNVNVQRLYSEWKEWWLLSDNSKFPLAFRNIGGDDLTPGVQAGAYFFLQNQDVPNYARGWRIISTDADQTVNYNGNLVAEDSAKSLIIPTPGRSVLHLGLQPVTQRVDEILTQSQTAQYDAKISIDTINGIAGTTYPIGTPFAPVSNLADAYTLAATFGFAEFDVRGSITLTQATGSTVWNGIGLATNIDCNGQDCSSALFRQMNIQGNMVSDGTTVIRDALMLGSMSGIAGVVENSALTGTITPSNTAPVYFLNCFSAVAGGGSPILDGNSLTALDITFRGWNGGIRLNNFTAGDTMMTVGVNTGKVNISASCTDFGDLQLRGVGTINNESALTEGLDPGDQIHREAFVDATDIALIRGLTAGNAVVSADDLTLTIYDRDASHVLATYSISADGRTRTRTT